MSGILVLPVRVTQSVEFLCLVFFSAELSLKLRYRGASTFWGYRRYYIEIGIIILDLAGVCLSALNPSNLTILNPLLRPLLFIVMHGGVRRSWIMLARILPSFVDVIWPHRLSATCPANH
jgi:hypothetical protein